MNQLFCLELVLSPVVTEGRALEQDLGSFDNLSRRRRDQKKR